MRSLGCFALLPLVLTFAASAQEETRPSVPPPSIPLCQVEGTWKSGEMSATVTEEATGVVWRGRHEWRGTYSPELGKLVVTRKPLPQEMDETVPLWAREKVAGQVEWKLDLTAMWQPSQSEDSYTDTLALEGPWTATEIEYSETKDEQTGQIQEQKASIKGERTIRTVKYMRNDVASKPRLLVRSADPASLKKPVTSLTMSAPFFVEVILPCDQALSLGTRLTVVLKAKNIGTTSSLMLKDFTPVENHTLSIYSTSKPVTLRLGGRGEGRREVVDRFVLGDMAPLTIAGPDSVIVSYGDLRQEIVIDEPALTATGREGSDPGAFRPDGRDQPGRPAATAGSDIAAVAADSTTKKPVAPDPDEVRLFLDELYKDFASGRARDRLPIFFENIEKGFDEAGVEFVNSIKTAVNGWRNMSAAQLATLPQSVEYAFTQFKRLMLEYAAAARDDDKKFAAMTGRATGNAMFQAVLAEVQTQAIKGVLPKSGGTKTVGGSEPSPPVKVPGERPSATTLTSETTTGSGGTRTVASGERGPTVNASAEKPSAGTRTSDTTTVNVASERPSSGTVTSDTTTVNLSTETPLTTPATKPAGVLEPAGVASETGGRASATAKASAGETPSSSSSSGRTGSSGGSNPPDRGGSGGSGKPPSEKSGPSGAPDDPGGRPPSGRLPADPVDDVFPVPQGDDIPALTNRTVKRKKPDGTYEDITDFDRVRKVEDFDPVTYQTKKDVVYVIEKKTAPNSGDVNKWVRENVTQKLDAYEEALSNGADLPREIGRPGDVRIGFEFEGTVTNAAFKAAVEEAIRVWKAAHPDRTVRLKWQ